MTGVKNCDVVEVGRTGSAISVGVSGQPALEHNILGGKVWQALELFSYTISLALDSKIYVPIIALPTISSKLPTPYITPPH